MSKIVSRLILDALSDGQKKTRIQMLLAMRGLGDITIADFYQALQRLKAEGKIDYTRQVGSGKFHSLWFRNGNRIDV